MIPEDLDDDARLAFDMMHVSQRLNQALGALAELEAVRDEIDAVLADHREGDA
jgi:hypothetical protein